MSLLPALEKQLEGAIRSKAARFHLDKDGRVLGAICLLPSKFEDGTSCRDLKVEVDLRSRVAKAWAIRQLRRLDLRIGRVAHPLKFNLTAPYAFLLDALERRGVGIHFAIIVGRRQEAMRALRRKSIPGERDLAALGLVYRPIRNEREVQAAGRLMRKVFSEEPQFGTFVAHPAFIRSELEKLREGIGQRRMKKRCQGMGFFDAKGRLLGWTVFQAIEKHPLLGRHGAVGFCLSRELRGHGLSKLVYRDFFQWLKDHGISLYIGGTSNPAVLKLGTDFGRRPLAFMMTDERRYFDRRHFLRGKSR